ncbi:MAG: glycosyltransferase family 4 protein [Phycisphaerae bacterium]|nr:glycosyltransferase family 4 protein [Phycisphaerae bacterium]
MKFALVILHADPSRGGAERYTHDLAVALAERGHEVTLLSASDSTSEVLRASPPLVLRGRVRARADQASDFNSNPNANPHPCPPPEYQGRGKEIRIVKLCMNGMTRTRRYRSFLKSLDAHLASTHYDIVHAMLPVHQCDLYHPHAGLAESSVKHARGRKRLVNLLNPRRAAFASVERALLSGPDAPIVLCLSQRMREQVLTDTPCSPDHAAVLFNAVDLNRFQPTQRIPHDRLRALVIAQDFARKGVKQAIEAVARVPDCLLTIAGGDHAAPYQRLTTALGISDRVKFIGPVADVRPLYHAADVFVLPTFHDPCSLVVLESLASGLPVISTRANGACEIMIDGVHGFVLEDANDVAALAAALEKMRDPSRRALMADACVALRDKLSFDAHIAALLGIATGRISGGGVASRDSNADR